MPRRRRRIPPPVERLGDGRYSLHLEPAEREFLRGLLGQLRAILTELPADDPRVRRLFPAAYHDDPERDAEFHRLMRDDLVASRLGAIDLLDDLLDGGDRDDEGDDPMVLLDEAGVHALMQAVNSLRLVLGTLIDVGEDEDPTSIHDDDPLAGEHHLYAWLSWLLEWSVQAVSGT